MAKVDGNLDKQLFEALNTVEDILSVAVEITPSMAIEVARTIGRILAKPVATHCADGQEAFYGEMKKAAGPLCFAEITAHCMLQQSEGPNDFSSLTKHNMLTTADILGPDHLGWWRKAIAFAIKAEQF